MADEKKTWNAYATVTAGKFLGTVKAETKEEAERLAWELDSCGVSVCHHCSGEVSDPEVSEITIEEARL
jgi:hypothetical protein